RELEQLSLTSLAVFCQQVSDTPEKYTETGAAEAARLKREWLALQKSPPVSLQEQEEVELKQEMVETEKVNALVKIEQPLRDVMHAALDLRGPDVTPLIHDGLCTRIGISLSTLTVAYRAPRISGQP